MRESARIGTMQQRMPSLQVPLLGEFCCTLPRATLRAFRATPYLRWHQVPALGVRALTSKAGSFFLCAIGSGGGRLWPSALVVELETVPGFALRAGWLSRSSASLREELFPS